MRGVEGCVEGGIFGDGCGGWLWDGSGGRGGGDGRKSESVEGVELYQKEEEEEDGKRRP